MLQRRLGQMLQRRLGQHRHDQRLGRVIASGMPAVAGRVYVPCLQELLMRIYICLVYVNYPSQLQLCKDNSLFDSCGTLPQAVGSCVQCVVHSFLHLALLTCNVWILVQPDSDWYVVLHCSTATA
jgi:hypothetical protein